MISQRWNIDEIMVICCQSHVIALLYSSGQNSVFGGYTSENIVRSSERMQLWSSDASDQSHRQMLFRNNER